MIFDLHNEADSIERQGFAGAMPTGPAKRLGMAFMRGGVGMANTALLAASAVREDPEPLFKLHDEVIEPARKYWTPDEPSTSKAMQYLEAFAELPLQSVGGPATLAASTVMNKSEELVNAGVSPMTAVGVGAFEGAVTAATMGIPAAGKTIRQTLLLAGANPVIGGAAAQASKSILEAGGYDEQAKAYDPFDLTARGIDFTLGLAFGGLAHYAKVKERLPVEVADAIDTVENSQKVRRSSPFNEKADPGLADVHREAYGKALESVDAGTPVDVSPVIQQRHADMMAALKDADLDSLAARDELGAIMERGEVIPDAELDSLLKRAYGPSLFRTELHPEEVRLREVVGKEAAALAEELAAEYPGKARIMPPHQDVAPWSMTREELFAARDNVRGWYDSLERTILGDQVKEWRQAVRRGNTEITDRIESGLKPGEVDALYGIGTKFGPDDFTRLADARDTVRSGLDLNGYTEKNLAGEIASALYEVGDKRDPGQMTPSEMNAYVKLDEAFKIVQEQGWDSKTVSDEALRMAASHFPDPEDALYMLNRFLDKDQQAAHYEARPADVAAGSRPSLLEAGPASEPTDTVTGRAGTEPAQHPAEIQDGQSLQAEALTETPLGQTDRQASGVAGPTSGGHDPLAYEVETLLRDHGDVPLIRTDADGQPVRVSARHVIDDARADIERTRKLEKAYQRAALCLGLG